MQAHNDAVVRALRAAAAALLRAGDVRSLRPGGPTVAIRGRKYVLSSDGGILGDREDDTDDDPRIIRQQGREKHRYLWVLDTEKQVLAMWRASDGNEKHNERVTSGNQATIRKLEKRGQLNRVTHDEFIQVDKHMRSVEDDMEQALQRSIDENKTDLDRAIDKAAADFFEERVREKVEDAIAAVEEGAVPLGYKPLADFGLSDADEHRRKVNSAMEGVLGREMTLEKFEDYCREQQIDLDAADIQATEWALRDMHYRVAVKYLPPR